MGGTPVGKQGILDLPLPIFLALNAFLNHGVQGAVPLLKTTLRGIASGYLLARHIAVRTYL
jgi:hypothetical protein